jgi:hypothetical protein
MSVEPSPNDKSITIQIPSKSAMGNIVDALVRKRPIGWSRKSYPTYYKRIYAEWIQKDIDAMLIDRQPRLYDITKFKGITNQSLYLRVLQAIMYLIDPANGMDLDGKYTTWRELIKIKRIPKLGVKLSFDAILEGGEQAEIVKGDDSIPTWKRDLDVYLTTENPSGKPFHKTGLALTPEQVDQLILELDGLSNIMHNITGREVKVVKFS